MSNSNSRKTEETENGMEANLEGLMAKTFPKCKKNIKPEIKEVLEIQIRKIKKSTPSHIIAKMLKISDKENLKSIQSKKRQITLKHKKQQLN